MSNNSIYQTFRNLKVALVYDRVNKWGGAERLLLAIKKIFPQAPLYTAVFNPKKASWASSFKIISSFLNRFPQAKSHHELYPWLTPLVFESFNFSDYDLVVSITSAEAKGIITKPGTFHLCYCLTPTRYWWGKTVSAQHSLGYGNLNYLARIGRDSLAPWLKRWDQVAAQRPDFYLAISKNIQKRIKKYYHRESEVVYPPVDFSQFKINPRDDREKLKIINQNSKFFLIVSRLVPYKKINLAIEAFNHLKLPLKIIGSGVELAKLKKIAGPKIEFLGELTDQDLISYYYACKAVICPQEEDFGLVSLEAQACGKPVISYRGGGALETIIESKTGEFFYPQTARALYQAILSFKPEKCHPDDCQKNANKFNQNIFIKKFTQKVRQIWSQSQIKS